MLILSHSALCVAFEVDEIHLNFCPSMLAQIACQFSFPSNAQQQQTQKKKTEAFIICFPRFHFP